MCVGCRQSSEVNLSLLPTKPISRKRLYARSLLGLIIIYHPRERGMERGRERKEGRERETGNRDMLEASFQ